MSIDNRDEEKAINTYLIDNIKNEMKVIYS